MLGSGVTSSHQEQLLPPSGVSGGVRYQHERPLVAGRLVYFDSVLVFFFSDQLSFFNMYLFLSRMCRIMFVFLNNINS